MSAAPFDAGLVVARLKAEVPQLRLVGRGADYAAIRSLADFPTPCAYVLLATETAAAKPPGHAPSGQVVHVRQMVEVVFGVATAIRNYREDRGDSLADELKQFVGDIRRSLIGYVPALQGARAIQWTSGRIEDYDASTALWVDIFKTQHAIGSATP